MKDQPHKNDREIAHYVFSGSTTMIGVCITVIALFKVMSFSQKTMADEILGFNTLFFMLAAFFSYLTLRNRNSARMERLADFFFFAGMVILLLVGVMIVFSTY